MLWEICEGYLKISRNSGRGFQCQLHWQFYRIVVCWLRNQHLRVPAHVLLQHHGSLLLLSTALVAYSFQPIISSRMTNCLELKRPKLSLPPTDNGTR